MACPIPAQARLARSDAWPNWYEGAEFRAIRDQSLAADR